MMHASVRLHVRMRSIEWFTGWATLLLGIVMLQPPERLHSSVFEAAIALRPLWVWGMVALALGIARLGALTLNGRWRPSPKTRLSTAVLTMPLWLSFTFAVINAPYLTTGVVFFPLLVVAELYSVWTASVDAGAASAKA